MTDYYFDSSALVKRYACEAGTDWVLQATDPTSGNEITIGRVTGAEVMAAIVRKHRQGAISATEAQQTMMDFETDFETEFHILEITPSVVQRAMKDTAIGQAALTLQSTPNPLMLIPLKSWRFALIRGLILRRESVSE